MRLFLTLCSILLMHVCVACDFCGCFMGITPYDTQSSISFLYRYRSFSGYNYMDQPHLLFPQKQVTVQHPMASTNNSVNQYKHGSAGSSEPVFSNKDYEIYTTAELRAKYFIHKRIEVNLILPFVMNSSRIEDENQKVSTLGDMTFLAAYRMVDKSLTEKFQQRFVLGAGIKLPTGNYSSHSDDGDRIDPLLQAGTGTIDYLGYLSYIFAYKKIGVNINSICKLSGENKYGERNGIASTSYLNVFLKLRSDKKLKLFPSLQGYYEYDNGLFIHNAYQNGTTMNVAMAGIGVDTFYKNISLNVSFQLPVYEGSMSTNLSNAGKFMVGITYSFNQHKYLVKN
jgi:hypothetical protein